MPRVALPPFTLASSRRAMLSNGFSGSSRERIEGEVAADQLASVFRFEHPDYGIPPVGQGVDEEDALAARRFPPGARLAVSIISADVFCAVRVAEKAVRRNQAATVRPSSS